MLAEILKIVTSTRRKAINSVFDLISGDSHTTRSMALYIASVWAVAFTSAGHQDHKGVSHDLLKAVSLLAGTPLRDLEARAFATLYHR